MYRAQSCHERPSKKDLRQPLSPKLLVEHTKMILEGEFDEKSVVLKPQQSDEPDESSREAEPDALKDEEEIGSDPRGQIKPQNRAQSRRMEKALEPQEHQRFDPTSGHHV